MSVTGPGNLWMEAEDEVIAKNMHHAILNVCANSSSRKPDVHPKGRIRSFSINEASKPIEVSRSSNGVIWSTACTTSICKHLTLKFGVFDPPPCEATLLSHRSALPCTVSKIDERLPSLSTARFGFAYAKQLQLALPAKISYVPREQSKLILLVLFRQN
ncbi:hypothetical protein BC332_34549 [Capsicum chinense]|nr:hypothetical protein BC332_34549 [Capsicum chinense]